MDRIQNLQKMESIRGEISAGKKGEKQHNPNYLPDLRLDLHQLSKMIQSHMQPQIDTSLGLPNTDRRLKDREKGEKRKKERGDPLDFLFFCKSGDIE